MKNEAEKTEALDTSTTLSLIRTFLALDSTLMSAVRTATALISFGYGFYRIIQNTKPDPLFHSAFFSAKEFGLSMIAIGVVSLIISTYGYWRERKILTQKFQYSHRSRIILFSMAVSAIGSLAFIEMILR